jgi:hypothetical protein
LFAFWRLLQRTIESHNDCLVRWKRATHSYLWKAEWSQQQTTTIINRLPCAPSTRLGLLLDHFYSTLPRRGEGQRGPFFICRGFDGSTTPDIMWTCSLFLRAKIVPFFTAFICPIWHIRCTANDKTLINSHFTSYMKYPKCWLWSTASAATHM